MSLFSALQSQGKHVLKCGLRRKSTISTGRVPQDWHTHFSVGEHHGAQTMDPRQGKEAENMASLTQTEVGSERETRAFLVVIR